MRKIILIVFLIIINLPVFSQADFTNYRMTSSNRTIVIPLYNFVAGLGNMLYLPPVCLTVKAYNQNDSLSIKGAFDTTGYSVKGFSGTGFPISLKRWDYPDSIITGGKIFLSGQTNGVEYQYSPFTPTCKYLLMQGNAYMSDTIYIKTLFIK